VLLDVLVHLDLSLLLSFCLFRVERALLLSWTGAGVLPNNSRFTPPHLAACPKVKTKFPINSLNYQLLPWNGLTMTAADSGTIWQLGV
jgi:hypothetical protein